MTPVAVCTGKHCRRRREFVDVREALADVDVVETRCLGLCRGPVMVVDPASDRPLVLERIRSPKQRRDLRRVVRRGKPVSDRLRARTVRGSKRRSVLRRPRRRR